MLWDLVLDIRIFRDEQHFLAHLPAMDAYFTNPNRHTQHEDAPGAEITGHALLERH